LVLIGAKGSGTVTAVTGSGNIASSGGTTPNITFTGTLPVANGGTGNTSGALIPFCFRTSAGGFNSQTLSASTTYYFVSVQFSNQVRTVATDCQYGFVMPRAGIITRVDWVAGAGTQNSSAQTSALSIYDFTTSTATSVGNVNTNNNINVNSFTGLSISVAAGDIIGLKMVTGAWSLTWQVPVIQCTIYEQ